MEIGLIGFPRSGKTTLFNALTGADAEVVAVRAEPIPNAMAPRPGPCST